MSVKTWAVDVRPIISRINQQANGGILDADTLMALNCYGHFDLILDLIRLAFYMVPLPGAPHYGRIIEDIEAVERVELDKDTACYILELIETELTALCDTDVHLLQVTNAVYPVIWLAVKDPAFGTSLDSWYTYPEEEGLF